MAGIRKNQANPSRRPAHEAMLPSLKVTMITAPIRPMTNPFVEKARPGNQGNNRGVRTAPAKRATRMAAKSKGYTTLHAWIRTMMWKLVSEVEE